MIEVSFIEHDSSRHVTRADPQLTLMQCALINDVPGIIAYCGGDGGCATCHVYIDGAWQAKTGKPSRVESNTLRFALDVEPGSRLSCQVQLSGELDGLIVRLPRKQI